MPIDKAGDGNLEPRSVSFDIGVGRFRILRGGGGGANLSCMNHHANPKSR